MKRMVIVAAILLAFLASAARAQQQGNQDQNSQGSKLVYYDTFSERWLNPVKWLADFPWCLGTLECVREIQNGQLRLETRNFGGQNSDSDATWSASQLDFVNPNGINSITADILLRSFSAIGCPANDATSTIVSIGGNFFNSGSGDPADDVGALLLLFVNTDNPKTILVANWNTQTEWTGSGSYPIGTPLTASIVWDKENHQFISFVKVKGESGPGNKVVVPYGGTDTTPPASPSKSLQEQVFSANCTSTKTSAQAEVFFDNVIINVPPRPAQ